MKEPDCNSLIRPTTNASRDAERKPGPGYRIPPGNRPWRTIKEGHSGLLLYCRICRNNFVTYDDFYRHNPCEVEDKTDDDEEEGDYKEPWFDGGHSELVSRLNAEEALEYLNNLDGGKRYEYVEPGPIGAAIITGGPILHINFKAKEKDCPGAKVETFFAQLRLVKTYPVVDCCVSLGPSQALPHWENAYLGGCRFCRNAVHHPAEKCEKLLMGLPREDLTWLFGYPMENHDFGEYEFTSGEFSD
ncbi:uncharacterized protein LOC141611537 [Silene latifolia]|uniref:uncharacterized protein LOC141611537 n=1 Tax=Silene latifolia TaxID=37657 RepID=UPI003D76B28D